MRHENMEIRIMARRAGVTMWEIARELGVSEPTLYRWLREALAPDLLDRINKAIDTVSKKALVGHEQ